MLDRLLDLGDHVLRNIERKPPPALTPRQGITGMPFP
jgi:hypothetical protein